MSNLVVPLNCESSQDRVIEVAEASNRRRGNGRRADHWLAHHFPDFHENRRWTDRRATKGFQMEEREDGFMVTPYDREKMETGRQLQQLVDAMTQNSPTAWPPMVRP